MKQSYNEFPESLEETKFPPFFESLAAQESLPDKVSIGLEEQQEIEDWIWDNVFRKEAVGQKGAWLYDHMEKTSRVLESAGINRHDFEHVKTVMINACAIFLGTQGLYLKNRYDLNTPNGRDQLFEKLSIVAISALFHDIGYLECIEDKDKFIKEDLDNHPLLGSDALYNYGHRRIGRPLRRAQTPENQKTAQLVGKLINQLFQPTIANTIQKMDEAQLYKNLRKVRSGISSHDSPEKQDVTEEAAKLDNIGGEAISVYLADKTHIGQRSYAGCKPESKETITSEDITVLHDRITYLSKGETFEITYGKNEIILKIKLDVKIPDIYAAEGYNEASFKADFQRGFAKRYQHTQKVFRRLMHREHLQNAPARLIIEADINGVPQEVLKITESTIQQKSNKLMKQMRP